MGLYHMLPRFLVGCDLGQTNDYTAITVVERSPERLSAEGAYELIYVERLPIGTSYTAVPGRLRGVIDQARTRWSTLAASRGGALAMTNAPVDLLVDQTGCGRPVYDYLSAEGLDPIAHGVGGKSDRRREELFEER